MDLAEDELEQAEINLIREEDLADEIEAVTNDVEDAQVEYDEVLKYSRFSSSHVVREGCLFRILHERRHKIRKTQGISHESMGNKCT